MSLHAITDTVGKFNRIAYKYWFKRFFEIYGNHTKLKNELVEIQMASSLTKEIESLIRVTYFRTEKKIDSLENISTTTNELFRKRSYEGSKFTPFREEL